MADMTDETGTLNIGEFHPAAHIAQDFIKNYCIIHNMFTVQEALASSALEGNRLAEVASETLRRLLNKEPVSDRYLMGLAWLLWQMQEDERDVAYG